jgi:hypothetical protein
MLGWLTDYHNKILPKRPDFYFTLKSENRASLTVVVLKQYSFYSHAFLLLAQGEEVFACRTSSVIFIDYQYLLFSVGFIRLVVSNGSSCYFFSYLDKWNKYVWEIYLVAFSTIAFPFKMVKNGVVFFARRQYRNRYHPKLLLSSKCINL